MKLGAPLMRVLVGGLFIGHGTQKLFGWFGGSGLEGTGAMMEKLGMRPPRRHALLSGVAEAGGGALLALGALTPLATAMLTGSMTTAIRKVHWANGPWITQRGWEYNAVLIAAVTALADHGPGRPSVDARVFPRLHGAGWALASLAAGVGGSYLASAPPFNQPPEPEPAREPTGRFERAEEPAAADT
jgi:putative oxidoreductase